MRVLWHVIEFDKDDTVLCVFETGAGEIAICARAKLGKRRLTLEKAHIDGPGANRIGIAGLRALARTVMEELNVDEIAIEGARRTTGAKPGRVPPPLRFLRDSPA